MTGSDQSDLYSQTILCVTETYDGQLKPLGDLALAKLAHARDEYVIDIGCSSELTCLQLADAVGATTNAG